MDVDVIKGKQGKDGKGKKGKDPKCKQGKWQWRWKAMAQVWLGSRWLEQSWLAAAWLEPGEREKEVDPGRTRRPAIFAGSSAWECPAKGKNKGRVNQAETNAVPNSSASTLTNASTTLPSARSAGAPSTRSRPFAVRLPPALPGYDCLG